MQYLGAISKMTEWFQLVSKTNINITLIQVFATNAEEDEAEQFFESLQYLLELTPPPQKKNVSFSSQGTEMQK